MSRGHCTSLGLNQNPVFPREKNFSGSTLWMAQACTGQALNSSRRPTVSRQAAELE